MILRLFINFIIFFPLSVFAHFDVEWERFIENTDLIVKGIIIEKRLVFDNEGYFSSYEGAINIIDVIYSTNKYTDFKIKKIDIGDLDYANRLGTVGYFFLKRNKKNWTLSERSSVWTVKDGTGKKYKKGDKKELILRQHLWDVPDELFIKKFDTKGKRTSIFTEEKLINYFLK